MCKGRILFTSADASGVLYFFTTYALHCNDMIQFLTNYKIMQSTKYFILLILAALLVLSYHWQQGLKSPYPQPMYAMQVEPLQDKPLKTKNNIPSETRESIPTKTNSSTQSETKPNPNPNIPKPVMQTKLALNCIQNTFPSLNTTTNTLDTFAYVWYATSNSYFCSAIVAMKHLQKLRKGSDLKVDFVLTYSKGDLLKPELIDQWKSNGGILREFDGLAQYLHHGYYKKCLQKFRAMLLFEYKRVIIMDSDGIANHNLDPLFFVPFPKGIKIAAPQASWFENQGFAKGNHGQPIAMITSILLVIEPTQELFDQMEPYFGKKHPRNNKEYFDMDIINDVLTKNDQMLVLPKFYGTLNSEYGLGGRNPYYAKCKNFDMVQYLHWTAIGKPWTYKESKYVNGHEEVIKPLIRTWYQMAHETCPWLVK